MNSPLITFVRQKSTGQKFVVFDNDLTTKRPVSSLPQATGRDAWMRDIEIKCEHCDSWHRAQTMHDACTGLACGSCHGAANSDKESTLAAAMRKAAALLRLAQSDNPHEAALAAARAQEIIDRYKLNIASATTDNAAAVESSEPVQNFDRDPLAQDATVQRWKCYLAMGIAKGNQCMVYTCGTAICLIGRASDVATVRYFFTYLVGEIERLAEKHCRGCGRTYWNNFRIGAAETVTQRLEESRAQTIENVKAEALANGGESALVVVNNSLALMKKKAHEVDLWAASNMKLRNRSAGKTRHHESARDAGRRAGRSIPLGANSGALGSGARAIQ